MNIIRQRIQDIIDLKKERFFVSGLLLGLYGLLMLSVIMANFTFVFLSKIENPWLDLLQPVGSLFMIVYFVLFTIAIGKEVVYCHIDIFYQWNRLTMWMLNKYTSRYYKKHKKDPPYLDRMSKSQFKILGWYYKLDPTMRKRLLISMCVMWFAWIILTRTDAISGAADLLENWLYELHPWFAEEVQ